MGLKPDRAGPAEAVVAWLEVDAVKCARSWCSSFRDADRDDAVEPLVVRDGSTRAERCWEGNPIPTVAECECERESARVWETVEETLVESGWREMVVVGPRETGAWEEEGPAEAARAFFAGAARVGAGAAAAAVAPSETLRYLRMVGVIGPVKLQDEA